MSYATVHTCANDEALGNRIQSSIAQEQMSRDEQVAPMNLLGQMRWVVAAASDVEAAYASALAADNPNPGGDESVITDGMILSHVQGNWPTPAA